MLTDMWNLLTTGIEPTRERGVLSIWPRSNHTRNKKTDYYEDKQYIFHRWCRFIVGEAVFHYGHELFNNRENGGSISAGGLSYLVNHIRFSHIVLNLMSFTNTKLLKSGQISTRKPAQNEQAESRIGVFTDAISCYDRLSVPFPGTVLSLCQTHEVSRFCRPAMLP